MPLPITDNKIIAISNDGSCSSSCLTLLSGHGATIVWNSTSATCTITCGTLVIAKAGSLTIGSSGEDNTRRSSSSITLEIAESVVLQNEGTISISGRTRISEGGTMVNNGTISNSGTIVNNKQGTIENQGIISNSNTSDNFGTIENGNSSNNTNCGRLVNSGYINSNYLGGKITADHTNVVFNSGYVR